MSVKARLVVGYINRVTTLDPKAMTDLRHTMVMGLLGLLQLVKKKEVNVAIYSTASDVPFMVALDTPDASQIVCDESGKLYDAWSSNGAEMRSVNLTKSQAAELITKEYFWAKAARAKQSNSNLKDLSIGEIVQILERGYQKSAPRVIRERPPKP
jgi:hypothetical protein